MAPGTIQCANCSKEFPAEYAYCPNCGQKSNDELTLSVLFSNTISNYFSVDARFFKSIGPLLFRPGFLPKKFVEGKRKTYLHPVRTYLFITIVFFFIFSFFVRESRTTFDQVVLNEYGVQVPIDSLILSGPEIDSAQVENLINTLKEEQKAIGMSDDDLAAFEEIIRPETSINADSSIPIRIMKSTRIDSLIAVGAPDQEVYKAMGMSEDAGYFKRKIYAQALKLYKDHGVGELYQKFFDAIPIATFFLLPVFALILMGLYFRQSKYVHHLVFSFYYFSFVFVIITIIYLSNRWFIGWPDVLNWVLGLVTLIYLWIGLKRYYNQSWKASIFKGVGVVFLFLLIIVPISAGLVGLYAFLYY